MTKRQVIDRLNGILTLLELQDDDPLLFQLTELRDELLRELYLTPQEAP